MLKFVQKLIMETQLTMNVNLVTQHVQLVPDPKSTTVFLVIAHYT